RGTTPPVSRVSLRFPGDLSEAGLHDLLHERHRQPAPILEADRSLSRHEVAELFAVSVDHGRAQREQAVVPVECHVADQTTAMDQEARHPVGDALYGSRRCGRDRFSELLERSTARRLETREVGVDALRFVHDSRAYVSSHLCTSAHVATPAAAVARSSSDWIVWRPSFASTNPSTSLSFAAVT